MNEDSHVFMQHVSCRILKVNIQHISIETNSRFKPSLIPTDSIHAPSSCIPPTPIILKLHVKRAGIESKTHT